MLIFGGGGIVVNTLSVIDSISPDLDVTLGCYIWKLVPMIGGGSSDDSIVLVSESTSPVYYDSTLC